jgi:myo-inositol catabolism protein IolH
MIYAYDPWMIRDRPVEEVCRFAAEAGYQAIELSPRDDFLPLFDAPRADQTMIQRLKRALRDHGLSLVSLWTVYRWAEADDAEAWRLSIDRFRRFIEIAAALDCTHISSEFGGTWQQPERCQASFARAIEEVLPVLERTGMTLSLDAHPGDWVEDGRAAVAILREYSSRHLRFLYSAPHSFYLDGKNDVFQFIQDVGDMISFVRFADTFDHRPLVRYIVNPLGAEVRVHQHLNIGEGEVDFQRVADGLKAISYKGVVSNSVFAWPDRAEESAKFMRRRMAELMD